MPQGEFITMQTMVEIPDALFQLAQRRAGQQGVSVHELIVQSLQLELSPPSDPPQKPHRQKRKLRPGFLRMWNNGELSGGTDSTQLISEDRDAS